MPSSLDNGFEFKNEGSLVCGRFRNIFETDSSHKEWRVHYPKIAPLSPSDRGCPQRFAAMAVPIREVEVEMNFDELFCHIVELRLLGGRRRAATRSEIHSDA